MATPLQEVTDFIENEVMSHETMKAKAETIIAKAVDKMSAQKELKTAYENFVLNNNFATYYDENGNKVYKVTNNFVQKAHKFLSDHCDWQALVDKYWDQVRGS